ncbi:S1 RNA-binding domain-containing protein [Nocardia sp. NBC_00416]|uniref:S1 RNA-binding domain-containing protein n=1 Tax=Nocardia sp. NBC_00416 TaxID=2975991 RepID=UPI002E22CAE3
MLPFVYRVTKYDPADRDEHGSYVGTQDTLSDHGPVEAAYLEAVAAFAEDSGVEHLAIREPGIAPGFAHFGSEPPIDGHGLAGLFPPDLTGFHDGALVPVAVGLELIRAMLRDNGAWCRLEVEGSFAVHVGWDQYVYVGSGEPCDRALGRVRTLGLFPERMDASPYDPDFDEPGLQRPADEEFWAMLRWLAPTGRSVILEEGFVGNASRWHRLTDDTLDAVRAQLTPRAVLTVWPELSTDVGAVLAELPDEGSVEIVWENENGQITGVIADETEFAGLVAHLAGARAAVALPLDLDNRSPLYTAVLPDSDGVLRARWRTEPTPRDLAWAFMKTLRRGQIVTGTVTQIAPFGIFVDIGGCTGMANLPELSWKRIDHPRDVFEVGGMVTAEILYVDMVREQVQLSVKALADCWVHCPHRVGQIVPARVTELGASGVFADIGDGLEIHIPLAELTDDPGAKPEQVVRAGAVIAVQILDIDRAQRLITLSHTRALADGSGTHPLA